MTVKTIDFRPARHLSPVANDPLREPSLDSLLRGPVVGGPLAKATKIEGPSSWDGTVTRRSTGKAYPGRYKFEPHKGSFAWVWIGN